MKITDVVRTTSKTVFEKIINDSSFKKVVTATMTLFVVFYGITIALGIAQPNALELVTRIVKMAIIFFLLTSWTNFQEIVVSFFESLTNDLTTIMTSAVVATASGTDTKVTAMDVFNFIDEQVLGLLLSVRFATIIGAIMTSGGIGIIIALMLASTVLSYLWTIIVSVQIFIMAAIARSLLYAISPIFLIFLLFKQTTPLFEGWLKQLINFSLQPVFLIGFMAFFNGVFFNYIDTMFDPDYKICYSSKNADTSGQTFKLSTFIITPKYNVMNETLKGEKSVPLSQVLDIFTLFVVIMLGTIMVKMNQWAVQAAAQLSEGGISFTQTMGSNSKMVQGATKTFGDAGRKSLGIAEKK
jgi:type IV secretion system protein VirB6